MDAGPTPDRRFFMVGSPLSPAEAAEIAGGTLAVKGVDRLARVAALDDASLTDAIVFAENAKAIAALAGREVGLCLTTPEAAAGFGGRGGLVLAPQPRLAFARICAHLYEERAFSLTPGVSAAAAIAADAVIHPTARISDGAEIGAGALIGPGAVIGPGVVIGPQSRIGANAVIMHAILGARVGVLAGAVIGEAGFGFAPGPDGLVRMPQLGRVLIGDDAEIGANSTIDRGALGDTVIGPGVKIDNLVQIGHNVRIGPNAVIAAQSGVSGSVVIGAGAMLGGQVGLADHLRIGEGARLAAQAGVMSDVPAGETWGGSPARPSRAWLRETAALAKLAARKPRGQP